ncbi:MAG: GNAT family N-acetyltransferase [Bacteroidia bacterium]|nr:GNAT family N-acetyltransferase [Bacteroidia bacterium]
MVETPRLILRNWRAEDVAPFAEMNADPEVRKYFPNLMSYEETENFVSKLHDLISENTYGFWAVETKENSEFIGMIGITDINFDAAFTPGIEIGWRLKQSAWNNGYATEGAKASLDFGFNVMQFPKIFSFTSVLNLPSERVMQKIGMQLNGNFVHPKLDADHWLNPMVLYVKENPTQI